MLCGVHYIAMERWQGRVALVTGASSGIGAGIAEALVKNGMKVIGCARSVNKIQEMATKLTDEKGTLYPEKCDLRNEEEILELFKRIKDQHGGVDVCINNAGLAKNAALLTGSTEHWMNMLQEISPGPTKTGIFEVFGGAEAAKQMIATRPTLNVEDVVHGVEYILGSPTHVEVNDVIIYPTRHP